MIAPIEDYYKRYDEAAKDPEMLETFWKYWGETREKACRNMRDYDKYQECGYTDEPRFNEYGWLDNKVPQEKVEVVRLFGEEPVASTVECLQLPNGKWVSGCHYILSEQGCSSMCSIWCKQYDSRISALMEQMRKMVEVIRKSKKQCDREHLSDLARAMDSIRQLSLF